MKYQQSEYYTCIYRKIIAKQGSRQKNLPHFERDKISSKHNGNSLRLEISLHFRQSLTSMEMLIKGDCGKRYFPKYVLTRCWLLIVVFSYRHYSLFASPADETRMLWSRFRCVQLSHSYWSRCNWINVFWPNHLMGRVWYLPEWVSFFLCVIYVLWN